MDINTQYLIAEMMGETEYSEILKELVIAENEREKLAYDARNVELVDYDF